mmetsp:Transcript_4341/g.6051  ORF Transcript_4341/g.6051 Transcript_4341/m.6051 type:complete len:237 (-) Transcript_4341:76-786(-)
MVMIRFRSVGASILILVFVVYFGGGHTPNAVRFFLTHCIPNTLSSTPSNMTLVTSCASFPVALASAAACFFFSSLAALANWAASSSSSSLAHASSSSSLSNSSNVALAWASSAFFACSFKCASLRCTTSARNSSDLLATVMLSGEVAMAYRISSGVDLGVSVLRMYLASASGLRVTLRLSGLLVPLLAFLVSVEEEDVVVLVEEDFWANLSARIISPMRRAMPPRIGRDAMLLFVR